ncbi:DUF4180 domain-containing protein [Aeromicrobium sp.]|uniref:DUF4180 domain-containing protein n=1 Tax=Aeromicrobium sp. TaxID=1871063 RepID=UPI0030C0CE6A
MAAEHLVTIHGTQVMVMAPDGIPLDTEGAAVDLIGEALGQRAEIVVIPAERLTDDFFELATGVAGEIAQKFVNYRVQLAIVGDIESRVDDSASLLAWVTETNRGRQLWFEPTFEDFAERLDR